MSEVVMSVSLTGAAGAEASGDAAGVVSTDGVCSALAGAVTVAAGAGISVVQAETPVKPSVATVAIAGIRISCSRNVRSRILMAKVFLLVRYGY